jgi:hypothetical protein
MNNNVWPIAASRELPALPPGVSPMLDSQWYDRAKAIRQTIVQLRDSL